MNVVCESEVFVLHGLVDEAVCVVLEDIKIMCVCFGVEVVGCVQVLVVYLVERDECGGNAFETCVGTSSFGSELEFSR